MAEKFADVKKVAGAAPEIENAHWRRTIEPKVLRAFDVDLNPVNDVFEAVDSRRARPIGILLAQLVELRAIERFQNSLFVDRVRQSTEMFERAGERIG